MNDLSLEDRLAKNIAVLQYLEWQVKQQHAKVRTLEAEVARDRKRRERARMEQSWKLQPQRAGRPAMLHRGGCTLYKTQIGYLARTEALLALEDEEIGLECCEICNPLPGLGVNG